jgi:hypothetical protein
VKEQGPQPGVEAAHSFFTFLVLYSDGCVEEERSWWWLELLRSTFAYGCVLRYAMKILMLANSLLGDEMGRMN